MKTAFYTMASSAYLPSEKKMEASLKKFHPDIELFVFGEDDIRRYREAFKNEGWHPYFGMKVAEMGYDLVIRIDADSVVCEKLDDVFNLDYEIAGVRNNGVNGFGTTYEGLPAKDYLNAGFIAVKNQKFWKEAWEKTTASSRPFGEQDILNEIFHSKKYKGITLDDDNSKSYYGCSTNGQYQCMKVKYGRIMLNDRVVRILHSAGMNVRQKLIFQGITPEVQERINELTK